MRDNEWYESTIREDLRAHGIDRWRARYRVTHPEIAFQLALRNVEARKHSRGALAKFFLIVAKYKLHRWSLRTGLQVPPGVAGPGLCLPHFGTVIVNGDARLGRGCRIHASTNIGANLSGVPVLGDFVYVGPGAVVYGPIRIGDGAVIGANSVVNSDVPAGATVAGVPARVISMKNSRELIPYSNEKLR